MSTPTTPKPPSKKATSQTLKNDAAIKQVAGMSLDKTLQGVSNTTADIAKTLATIQQQLVGKHQELEALATAIQVKTDELAALHGKDQILQSMDELQIAAKARAADHTAMEIETRKKWDDERAETIKLRLRDEEQYQYTRQQTRASDLAADTEAKRTQAIMERERLAEIKRDIAEREKVLADRETEHAAAKAKVDRFDDDLKAAVAREIAIVTNSMKREYTHAAEMAKVQFGAEIAGMQVKLDAQISKNADQAAVIAALENRLSDALKANQEIARSAVESAGNQRALAELSSFGSRGDNGSSSRTKS